jgi:hypothetical protein
MLKSETGGSNEKINHAVKSFPFSAHKGGETVETSSYHRGSLHAFFGCFEMGKRPVAPPGPDISSSRVVCIEVGFGRECKHADADRPNAEAAANF